MAISSIRKASLLGLPAPGTRLPHSAGNDNRDFEKALCADAYPFRYLKERTSGALSLPGERTASDETATPVSRAGLQ